MKSSTTPGTSCGTYYKYYQLSGSSWNAITNSTSNSGSYDVRCVYGGTGNVGSEAFYSLSGGGGGAAPAILDNAIDSNVLARFRQKIKENVGGYIVLEIGEGGTGGAKSTNKNQKPMNATAGGRSCVAITGVNKADVKYRLCVPGGKFGYSGDGTKANASSAGWGAAGAQTPIASACYEIDYTSDTNGVVHNFDCSRNGNSGTNGGASSSNPTPGGKGGASVLNNTQVGGTAVVDGISASSSNYGAGGGGGSASKTGLGANASYSFGTGGNGAGGYIYLNYKVKYDAGGGGGGGAGSFAVVKEFRISNESECTFVIGKGGAGGGIAADGYKGGDTSVTCTNGGGEAFKVIGGEGGGKGTTASTLGGYSIGGSGGMHGEYSADIIALPPSKVAKKTGYDGTKAGFNDRTYTNYIQGIYSAGGRCGSSRE